MQSNSPTGTTMRCKREGMKSLQYIFFSSLASHFVRLNCGSASIFYIKRIPRPLAAPYYSVSSKYYNLYIHQTINFKMHLCIFYLPRNRTDEWTGRKKRKRVGTSWSKCVFAWYVRYNLIILNILKLFTAKKKRRQRGKDCRCLIILTDYICSELRGTD